MQDDVDGDGNGRDDVEDDGDGNGSDSDDDDDDDDSRVLHHHSINRFHLFFYTQSLRRVISYENLSIFSTCIP